ncbi:hypothetical protein Z042_05570 [Chania multitudinisentens RB-25]|uniref:Uncharacterized protein n=1 Tax=Chania multitudinisentens RB-25 TaxID=1441930 RepID=W0LJQ9_9GAMM|nr:hypothetical protein Z042_05570 [Chania multitudinisentens RB-25]
MPRLALFNEREKPLATGIQNAEVVFVCFLLNRIVNMVLKRFRCLRDFFSEDGEIGTVAVSAQETAIPRCR